MKSSGTSDLIDNINPPSVLDDISMTNSCASLNSISSDILESRSQSLADPRSNSEMFQRLNAAAAMVQVYSRELSNIMTGSMKSSCNSDCLDLVKPPSIFQDIAEVTVEDGTEVASDPLVSDFELEEELPHDDEASVPSETVHSQFLQSSKKDADGSTENLNSSVDGDSLLDRAEVHSVKKISSLALEPQNTKVIDIDSNSIQHSFPNMTDDELVAGIAESQEPNESLDVEDSASNNQGPSIRRGPRIVKPINRETVRQMQEKKNAEKSVKSIRGRGPVNKPRNLLQQVTTGRLNGTTKNTISKTTPPIVSGVRPTRTSALRASQNKQATNRSVSGRVSPRSFLSKPPTINRTPKVIKQPVVKTSSSSSDSKTSAQPSEIQRPSPPVKQGTFTKEESSSKVPTSSSPASDELPSDQSGDDQNNNDKPQNGVITSPCSNEPKVFDRKLSFTTPPANVHGQANRFVQRKLSAPVQRKTSEKTGLPLSPSSHSLPNDDKTGKKTFEKKSPSNNNVVRTSAVGSRTASTNSLSSLSSNSLSVKKSNSQKDVPSKISSIWKRSESSSSASPDNSNTDKVIPGSSRNRILSSRSATLRCNSVTPPAAKSIPRSSTYEKISKSGANATDSAKQQQTTSNTVQSMRPRQTATVTKPVTKKYQPPASKPSGGPRIVKPVTPRPKINAITSKSLRQSNYSPFSDMRSYAISSGSSACISVERTSRSFQDSKVSIPLVTAPFAYGAQESNPLKMEEQNVEDLERRTNGALQVNGSSTSPFSTNKKDSDSDHSDKEDA